MHPVLTEITSTLHKLLSKKNKLSLNFTNTAWHKYFCFSVIMHWVFTEITSILQKLFSKKKPLNLNSANAAWHITHHRNISVKTHTFLSHMHWILLIIINSRQKCMNFVKWYPFMTKVCDFWQIISAIYDNFWQLGCQAAPLFPRLVMDNMTDTMDNISHAIDDIQLAMCDLTNATDDLHPDIREKCHGWLRPWYR